VPVDHWHVGRDGARARRHARPSQDVPARDDRADIVDREVTDHGVLAITSFYVRYLLPMMVEIQWWDFKKSDEPA
jgi:hypothetical protein